jgi:hypothetical protein
MKNFQKNMRQPIVEHHSWLEAQAVLLFDKRLEPQYFF